MVSALRVMRTLGPIDALSIQRDALLRWILVLPLAVAVLARLVLPAFLTRLGENVQLDLLPYYAPLTGIELLLFAPALAGMVVGFLLLDERDDRSLLALAVSPLPPSTYLFYRLLAPVAISTVLTLVTFPLAGLSELDAAGVLIAAVAAAPLAPMIALVLGAFAENKVQGFALVKGLGVVLPAPLIAYFVDAPWTLALGLVPTYWPARVYWALLAEPSAAWWLLIVGLLYQSAVLAMLLRFFSWKMHRASV